MFYCSGENVIRDREYTGERKKCVLIDSTMREFETAKLAVSTPFFTGQLEALVMQSPLCDLITGNVLGAKGSDDPAVAAAVEIRGQRQKAMRKLSAPCGKQGVKATPLEVKGLRRMTRPCVVCCKRPRRRGAEGSPGRYSRVSGEQGTVVPGFYKLQDRMGDVAVGRAVPVP